MSVTTAGATSCRVRRGDGTGDRTGFAGDGFTWPWPLPRWKMGTWPHSALGVGWCTPKDDRRSPTLPSCPPPIRFTSPLLESNRIRLDDGPMSLVRFARRGAPAIGRRHPQRSSIPVSTTDHWSTSRGATNKRLEIQAMNRPRNRGNSNFESCCRCNDRWPGPAPLGTFRRSVPQAPPDPPVEQMIPTVLIRDSCWGFPDMCFAFGTSAKYADALPLYRHCRTRQ